MRHQMRVSLLGAVFCLAIWGQPSGGNGAITGYVRDSYGDGLPDATVLISNPSIGVERSVDTNIEGVFFMPALPPAAGYRVTVTKTGFVKWTSEEMKLATGETLNMRIQVHEPDTTVEVKESPLPGVETATSALVERLDAGRVLGIPTSSLRPDELALLAPAVSISPTGTLAFRANPFYNPLLVDGQDVTNRYYFKPRGQGQRVPAEALETMQVEISAQPLDAEPANGGVINAAIKSGTSGFHGSAYGFARNKSLQAFDRYSNGYDVRGSKNVIGASLGGPIIPRHLFFFANAEKMESKTPGLSRLTNPFLTTANCKSPASTLQCTAANALVQSRQNILIPRTDDTLAGVFGLDARIGSQHSVTVRANALHRDAPFGLQAAAVAGDGSLLSNNANVGQESRDGRASWVWTPVNSLTNEVRASLFQDRVSTLPYSMPSIATGNVGIIIAGTDIGGNRANMGVVSEQRKKIEDNVTVVRSKHILSLGLGASVNTDNIWGVRNSLGTYEYATLNSFARDLNPTTSTKYYMSYSQSFGNPARKLETEAVHISIDDTWKLNSRMTVTGGVRWDDFMLPQPATYNTTYTQTLRIPRTKANFAPRLGLAIAATDKTVFRMGFGMYYSPYAGEIVDALYNGNGITQASISVNPTQSNAPVFPKVYAAPTSLPGGTANLTFANGKWKNELSRQFNYGFDHQLGKDGVLSINGIYVGGSRLWSGQDNNVGNYYATGKTYAIYKADGTNTSFLTPIWNVKNDANYAHLWEISNGATSKYNAFTAQIRKPVIHDLSLAMAYTWSHATDDLGAQSADGFLPRYTYSRTVLTDKGSSATDQRHRFTATWLWAPKPIKSDSAFARYLVNGWEVATMASLASSLPKTAVVLVDGQQFSGVTMLYLNSFNGSGGWSRSPLDRINSLKMGRQYNLDARFTRTLPFTERIRGALSFEAFNIANAQWNTNVNTIAYVATSGTMTSVPSLGTGTSTASYPDGTNARRAQFSFRLTF